MNAFLRLPTLVISIGFSSCTSYHPLIKHESTVFRMDSTYAEKQDSAMLSRIAPFKANMEKQMNVVIGVSEHALFKDMPEGTLGNFTADIVLKKARDYNEGAVDVCLLNNGGLRNPIPKGAVTMGNIYQLMPFENEIVIIQLGGEDFKKMLDFIANKGGMPVSGLNMVIRNNMPAEVFVNGKEFELSATYTIATSDYLAGGGDNMSFFSDKKKISTGIKIRDAIIEHLKKESEKGNAISVKKDGRIKLSE